MGNLELDTDTSGHPTYRTLFCNKYYLQICRFALLFEYLSILEENKLNKTSLLRTTHLYNIEGHRVPKTEHRIIMEPADSNGGMISNPAGSNSQPESAQSFESSQHFCLRWNNYQTNLTNVFDQLLQNESFVDVTLTTDETGQSVKCHKVVLSACSPFYVRLKC